MIGAIAIALGLIEVREVLVQGAALNISNDGLPGQENSALFLKAADHIVIGCQEDQTVLFLPGLIATVT